MEGEVAVDVGNLNNVEQAVYYWGQDMMARGHTQKIMCPGYAKDLVVDYFLATQKDRKYVSLNRFSSYLYIKFIETNQSLDQRLETRD